MCCLFSKTHFKSIAIHVLHSVNEMSCFDFCYFFPTPQESEYNRRVKNIGPRRRSAQVSDCALPPPGHFILLSISDSCWAGFGVQGWGGFFFRGGSLVGSSPTKEEASPSPSALDARGCARACLPAIPSTLQRHFSPPSLFSYIHTHIHAFRISFPLLSTQFQLILHFFFFFFYVNITIHQRIKLKPFRIVEFSPKYK